MLLANAMKTGETDSSFSYFTANPEFEFAQQSDIIEYRCRIGNDIIWRGTSSEEFRNQLPQVIDQYIERIALSPQTGCSEMISLTRFYGPLIPENEREVGKGPTKSVDAYLILFEPYFYQGHRVMCLLNASQVNNGHVEKYILCYEPKARSEEELKLYVLNYLSGKIF